jgi:hypothetical protein
MFISNATLLTVGFNFYDHHFSPSTQNQAAASIDLSTAGWIVGTDLIFKERQDKRSDTLLFAINGFPKR